MDITIKEFQKLLVEHCDKTTCVDCLIYKTVLDANSNNCDLFIARNLELAYNLILEQRPSLKNRLCKAFPRYEFNPEDGICAASLLGLDFDEYDCVGMKDASCEKCFNMTEEEFKIKMKVRR